MTIEIAADQFQIVRPTVKSIRSGMNADKTMARPNKVEQTRFLRITMFGSMDLS